MTTFSEFGEGDYDAFAGACPVSDRPPMIAYFPVEGWPEFDISKPGQVDSVAAIIDGSWCTIAGDNHPNGSAVFLNHGCPLSHVVDADLLRRPILATH